VDRVEQAQVAGQAEKRLALLNGRHVAMRSVREDPAGAVLEGSDDPVEGPGNRIGVLWRDGAKGPSIRVVAHDVGDTNATGDLLRLPGEIGSRVELLQAA